MPPLKKGTVADFVQYGKPEAKPPVAVGGMKLKLFSNFEDTISKDPFVLKVAMIIMTVVLFLGTIWALSLLIKGVRAIWRHCFRHRF